MASVETDNEIKKQAYNLCRTGEYRKAALISLKARRIVFSEFTKYDLALPLSLLKCGKRKASIIASLRLLSSTNDLLVNAIGIIAQALSYLEFDRQELIDSLSHLQLVSLSPAQAAIIAEKINDKELCDLFVETVSSLNCYTESDILFIDAAVAHSKGDDLTAMRNLHDIQSKGMLFIDAALLAASILRANGYLSYARKYACFVIRENPSNISALNILGQVLYMQSKWKAARRVFKIVNTISGDDISMLNMYLTMPQVPLSKCELSSALNSFCDGLSIISSQGSLKGIEFSLRISVPLCHSFYLAYHGDLDLRLYLEKYNNIIRLISRDLLQANIEIHSPCKTDNDVPVSNIIVPRKNKISIGFLSRYFSQHSNLQAHEGIIANLDRDEFEVILIHRPGAKRDLAHARINSLASHIIYLDEDFGEACKTISDLNLDILFYTDIGMYPLDNILPMARLAYRQVTGWGIPHTSGLIEIDHYMRSSIFDDCEKDNEYTENLARLQGYIGYFDLGAMKLLPKSRDYFLLPPDRILIGCTQSLHKIHPAFDVYLEEVARLDKRIMIVIVASDNDLLNHRFAQRIRRTAPTAYAQICFLQKMSTNDYYSLNNVLDLNLDTIHYGAGITFVHTAWCGPPCVTLRGRTVRSSVVSRSYEYAEISDAPIARQKNEYIELVEALVQNKCRREAMANEIRERSKGSIYNNLSHLESAQEFFKRIVK